MTYNVHAWRDASHKCNFDRIVQIIQTEKPDILCLNEVLHPFARPSSSSSLPSSESTTTYDSPAAAVGVDEYYQRVQEGQGQDTPIHPCFIPNDESSTFLHRLAAETNLRNIEFNGATDNSYFGKGTFFGNAILTSKSFPIENYLHVPLEVEDGDLELGGQTRDFVEPRAFSAVKILINQHRPSPHQQDDNQQLSYIGVAFGHLDHKSEELRQKQVRRGIQKTQPLLQGLSHVVCGDFNTFQKIDCDAKGWQAILDLYHGNGWPEPPEKSLVLDALVELGYEDTFYNSHAPSSSSTARTVDVTQGVLPEPTSWTNRPLMRIDHIFVKNIPGEIKIVPIRHYRVESDASDHFPVVLEAELQ